MNCAKFTNKMRKDNQYGIALATLSARIGILTCAGVAQLVEQLTCNQQVQVTPQVTTPSYHSMSI